MKRRVQIRSIIMLLFTILALSMASNNSLAETIGASETRKIKEQTITVSTAGEYQYYSFTTPAKDGHFFLQSKNISIPAHTTPSYADLYVEIYDSTSDKALSTHRHVRPDYGSGWLYSDCALEPATTYNVRVKAGRSSDGDYKLPGQLEYAITYKSDIEPDVKAEAAKLEINEAYRGTLVSNEDEDWFVLKTDSGMKYEFHTQNIDVHTHSSWYYDELMYRATLYDANETVVTDIRRPINDKASKMLELKPNSTYYVQIKNYCKEPASTRLKETGEYLISLGHPMITDADVTLEKTEYIFTGEEIRPDVTVTYEGTELTENTDYTVKYENNIEKGTGKVIVTGINNYGGVVTKEFTIGGYTEITVADKFEGYVNEDIVITADIKTNICSPDSSNVTWRVHHSYDAETDFGTMTSKNVAKESYTISRSFKTDMPGKYELEIETKDGEIAKTKILVKPAKVEEFSYINHVGWIRLLWKKMEGIDGYRIDYSWTENGTIQESYRFVSSALDQEDIKKLLRGVAHEFSIRAFKNVDDEKLYGEKVEVGATIIDLPLTMDCWGFVNPCLIDKIGPDYFEQYSAIAQANVLAANPNYNGWNGLCYGLSKVAGQILIDKNPNVSTYEVESLQEFNSWILLPRNLKNRIKEAHASQVIYREDGIEVNINQIIQNIDSYLYHGGAPVFLRIFKSPANGGHILWAQDYSLEKDGTAKIYVYDTFNPSPDWGVERILTLSGNNYSNWSYDGGELGVYSGQTGWYENNQWTFGAGTREGTTVTNMALLEIDTTNSNGEVDVTEFDEVVAIDSYAESSELEAGGKIYWIRPQDTYKVTTLPAGAKLTIAMETSSASVQVSEDSTMKLEMDDNGEFRVELSSKNKNNIETSFYEYDGEERIVTTTTATSPVGNGVLIEKENDQLKITGIEKLAVTEKVELDTEDDEYRKVAEESLPATETNPDKEYLVEENGESTVLKEDNVIVSEFDKQDERISFDNMTATLSETKYVYNGKQQIPTIKVVDNAGNELRENVDYEVTVTTNAKDPGTHEVVVSPKGIYGGAAKKLYYQILSPIPSAPASAKAELSGGHNAVKFSWTASKYATGYDVYYKVSTASAYTFYKSVAATSCMIENLSENVTYQMKVIPYYNDGGTKYQDPNAYKTASVMTKKKILAPSSVKTVLYGYDDVKVTWTKSTGAAGYVVYYKTANATDYKKLTSTTKLTCNAANLDDGVQYTFKVVPYYKNGTTVVESFYSKIATISTLAKLGAPAVVKASSSKVTISWQKIEGASGYELSKSTSKSKTNVVTRLSGSAKTLSTTRNKTYYYKIRAYKIVNSKRIYGPWSLVTSYNLRYVSSQSKITASLYGYDDVQLSWKKVSGANAYDIYYKKSGDAAYTRAGATTSRTYKVANLEDGVTYAFKVVPSYKSGGKVLAEGSARTATIVTLKQVEVPTVTKYSSSKVKVSWKNIGGESGYQISRSTSATGTKVVSTYKTTSGKSKTITAKKGTTYYYKVRAYRTVGSKKIYGPWSETVVYQIK